MPQPPRGQQPADVVRQRHVADQQHDRLGAGRGRAEGRGHGAVDAVGAAVAEHPRGVLADRPEALDVTHRHRGGHEQRRLGRQQRPQLGGHRRLAEGVPVEHLRQRAAPPARRPGASPPATPARPPAAPAGSPPAVSTASRSSTPAGSSASERLTIELGSCQAPSGSSATCSTEPSPASQPRSGLETGRSPTRSTRSGSCAAAKRASRSSMS